MALLDSFLKAGQTPWALAQQHDWSNPGSNMAMLPEDEIAKLLGLTPPGGRAPTPVQAAPMPMGGAARLNTPPVTFEGEPQSPGQAPAAPMSTGSVERGRLPAPAMEPTAPAKLRASTRPDFNNEPGGMEIVGSLLQGAGGIVAPLGKMMAGSGERRREAEAKNETYDWLIRQGTPPEDAKFLIRNPMALKATIEARIGSGGTTDELKEYQFDVRQRQARGERDIPTFGQWKTDLKKAGATKVDVRQGEENSFARETGKLRAQRLDSIGKGADLARSQIANLDAVEAGLDAYNQGSFFGTGKLAPYEASMRAFGQNLGIGNAATIAGGELAAAIQNRMALLMRNPDGGMGMPGALSDADREFLRSAQPGLDKSPAANKLMIEIMRRMEKRKIEVNELANAHVRQHKTLDGFEEVLQQYTEGNPMFSDLKRPDPVAKGTAGPPRVRTYNPNTGKLE